MPNRIRTYTGPGQRRVHAAVAMWWRTYGESPTRAELARYLGISREVVGRLARKLHRDGLLVVVPRVHRGMEVVMPERM